MSSPIIAGVVLAGGRSTRMQGRDKSFLSLKGKALIDRVIERATPQVEYLFISTNASGPQYQALGLPLVPDSVQDYAGPLAGLLSCMELVTAKYPDISYLVSLPVDSPFYPTDLVERLVQALESQSASIAIPRFRGQGHWVFGLWSMQLLADLRHQLTVLQQHKVQDFIATQQHCWVDFDALGEDPFFNINNPDDLALAATRLE